MKKLRKFIYTLLIPVIRLDKRIRWQYYLKNTNKIKLVVGAGQTNFPGWFSTDKTTLDVTKEDHFKKYFKNKKICNVLAEHVLEHLTTDEILMMTKNFYKYSTDDVNIRIAVPDGFHIDSNYINIVKPGGTGAGADDHKHLFNYKSLSALFEAEGFFAHPLDFWDEFGNFTNNYSNDSNGFISRSFINDDRNVGRKPVYTSLIIDFKKKHS